MPKGQPTWITYEGVTRCLSDWERVLGFPDRTLAKRLRRGWPVDEAFLTPSQAPRPSARAPRGIAPHIAGPAIAIGGQWMPVALWLLTREEDRNHA